MSIQLETLTNVKTHLDISTTSHDTMLTSLIKQVSASIEKFLNRSLSSAQYTEYFNGGRLHYYVKAYPIDTSKTLTVTVKDSAKTVNDDYYVWADDGLFEFESEPSDSEPKIVKIVYTGGYTVTDGIIAVPDDLKRACTLEVVRAYRNRDKLGFTSVSYPDGNISTLSTKEFLPEVLPILQRYRRSPTVR